MISFIKYLLTPDENEETFMQAFLTGVACIVALGLFVFALSIVSVAMQ